MLASCRALREAVLRQATENPGQPVDDSKYKGMNNYIDYRAGFRCGWVAWCRGDGLLGWRGVGPNLHARSMMGRLLSPPPSLRSSKD